MIRRTIKNAAAAGALALFAGVLIARGEAPATNPVYSCTFTTNGWSRDAWMLVDRPDMKAGGNWTQGADYIENDNPEHTSMVYPKWLHGDATVACTMSFADRMAPSVVIAARISEPAGKTAVYQEHFEIVLWDQGINVWHHVLQNGKSRWVRTAFCTVPLKKNEKHRLEVRKAGKELTLTVGTTTFGYVDPSLPDDFRIGITGEEGVNRFYDFAVKQ
jgi:hypothetical protein